MEDEVRNTILVVEHEESLLSDILKVVNAELRDWQVKIANNITDALEIVKSFHVDVLITDLLLNHKDLEEYDGIKMASQIRKTNKKISIIIVSSYLGNFLKASELSQYDKLDLEFIDRNQADFSNYLNLLALELRKASHKINKLSAIRDLNEIWRINLEVNYFSYWIVLSNGLDIETDKNLISEALVWQKFFSRYEANLVSAQPGDPLFDFLSDSLSLSNFPVIIVSDNESMKPNIKLKPTAIAKLLGQKDGLRKLFVKIHVQLKNGVSISTIGMQIKSKEYWDWLLWGINEFKEFLPYIE